METLLSELKLLGLSNDQLQTLFTTIHEWLDSYYPVMAKIAKQPMAHDLGIKELSMSPYIIIDRY